ncbi:hypothetical protein SCHPADRAFT_253488 [Schizopora paradoxa]|uniref:Secreted protein n=1 Tax=Schizopora paradoxa TaxID=27342 RepID=A0A0H2S1D8_9AGAM|nr:hypothetical protein SCHPADRAFT_253488 [Schizopora paradoxa]
MLLELLGTFKFPLFLLVTAHRLANHWRSICNCNSSKFQIAVRGSLPPFLVYHFLVKRFSPFSIVVIHEEQLSQRGRSRGGSCYCQDEQGHQCRGSLGRSQGTHRPLVFRSKQHFGASKMRIAPAGTLQARM